MFFCGYWLWLDGHIYEIFIAIGWTMVYTICVGTAGSPSVRSKAMRESRRTADPTRLAEGWVEEPGLTGYQASANE